MGKEYDQTNIFRKIIDKSIPAEVIIEDEQCIAFKDINPKAETHVLIIPKVGCIDFADFVNNQTDVSYFFQFITKVVETLGLSDYRLVMNKGSGAGQCVFHFHVHLLAGNLSNIF